MNELLKRLGIGALIGLFAGLLISYGSNVESFFLTDLLDGYEFQSYDARMRAGVAGVEEASIDTVVIIDIEQQSTLPVEEGGLGRYFNWPQAYHGQLIDVVTSGEPAALLFDIIFDPENTFNFDLVNALNSDNVPNDEYLSDVTNQFLVSNDPTRFVYSTYESQKAYHALVFEQEDSLNFLYKMDSELEGYDRPDHIIQLPESQAEQLPKADRMGNTFPDLLQASVRTGSANFPQDSDGIIRRSPTAIWFEGPDHVYPSLTMAAAMDILGVPNDGFVYNFEKRILTLRDTTGTVVREIPIDEKGRMYVNYYGYYKTFYYLPYMYCMDPEMLDPSYWKGKVALVGASLPGLMDLRNTPVQETFAGVEVHANVIHSILQNEFVSITDETTNLWSIIFICVLLGLLVSIPSKPLYTLPVPLVAIVVWVIFTYNEYLTTLIMWEIVRPSISIGGTYLGIFLYNFLVVEKDKRFLKNTFSTYISPELIDQMYDNKEEPSLGGEEGYHTAFFTDIQSFSAFSEKLTASDLVELLNDYLTEMTDILLENKGTLDKYIGDAIVAFYGAPAPVDDHEYWACLTAVKMQERLAELREKWQGEGDRWPEIVHHMQNRIGVNTGSMVTGNMGSTMRMNYTMMGDTVNLAARLEASAKQYGVYIQVADDSYKACKDKFIWRDLDYVIVMGKSEPAQVFELISEAGKMPAGYDKLLPAYHEAVKLYRNQDWKKAIEAFKASDELEDMFPVRKTNPSRIYIPRCEHYRDNPPGDDWDGSWALTKK
ncbi:MAG TPA: adenylate/guanylate cyclase domain-containing protein [Candidatus Marinimicrobia bacterium]|jgi:adenylate cyclase|nr:adenylate/guanylate cyclase domain-containing protein [Candidatus Neomarinimicrobiota bacterium]HJM70441.1 adenylate/guanylate cyclase domain-containing protein [Candidatus Neomarinimicrobiota bacterium]|tara:strand:+ start:1919 stop:4228 length:2310 start_codon:yes stop_codon:yes gene_type:complete